MLSRRQNQVVLVSAAAAGVAAFFLGQTAKRPIPKIVGQPGEIRFSAGRAIEFARVLAEDYPDRVTGTPGARRAATYLLSTLQSFGYTAAVQPFSMWLAGNRVQGEDVVASLAGDTPETVAVVAHYDGQTTSHQAAEDNASGVGVMIELARALAGRAQHRGLIFVSSDAEEWGMIGARALVPFFKSRRTLAVISIDYLNRGKAAGLAMDCSGQSRGYTPLWLRQVMVEAGRAQDATVAGPTPAWEWVERAVEVSAQDQGPLLRAGIPALNISTLTEDYAAARARYHTFQDVFQDFDPASFQKLGSSVEQAVLTLETLPPQLGEGMNDWRFFADRYLPGNGVWLIQLLGLLPVLLAGVFAVRNVVVEAPSGWLRLFVRPSIYLLPPVLALFTLYALTAANVLKRYELYPATPKDPFLYSIPLQVTVPMILALIAGYGLVRKFRALLGRGEVSRELLLQILYAWLSVVVVCAFLLNPYALWFYLGLFAYGGLFWRVGRRGWSRALNAALLVAAAAPFAALAYFFGREIFLGWRILWYMVLQAAYEVWSPFAVVLFLSAMVLWIQILFITVFSNPRAAASS